MKTLKDLLQSREEPVTGQETAIYVEAVKATACRVDPAFDLIPLGDSIEKDGLRRPITLWSDGTLISGGRRLRVYFLLAAATGKSKYRTIPVVHVDTIEDAAKRLLADNGDEGQSVPLKPSEICKLWSTLRTLDAPACARRIDAARRLGVELRKQTRDGKRPPGRSNNRGKGDEYLMSVLSEPFGMSEATATRLWTVYRMSGDQALPEDRREQAAQSLAAIDKGEVSIWAAYSALIKGRSLLAVMPRSTSRPRSAPASRQRAGWERSLPQMEGLVAGLTELGTPHPDLTWEQVGPTRARLMRIRRDLEKIINGMKEKAQS